MYTRWKMTASPSIPKFKQQIKVSESRDEDSTDENSADEDCEDVEHFCNTISDSTDEDYEDVETLRNTSLLTTDEDYEDVETLRNTKFFNFDTDQLVVPSTKFLVDDNLGENLKRVHPVASSTRIFSETSRLEKTSPHESFKSIKEPTFVLPKPPHFDDKDDVSDFQLGPPKACSTFLKPQVNDDACDIQLSTPKACSTFLPTKGKGFQVGWLINVALEQLLAARFPEKVNTSTVPLLLRFSKQEKMSSRNYGSRRVPKTQQLVAPLQNEPFEEWSREQKDAFAQKRMDEMKLKNQEYKKRYDEVENDRKRAEEKKASVTSILNVTKEIVDEEPTEIGSKDQVFQREWDKGKSLFNLEHWNNRKPDNHFDNYEQMYWRAYGGDKKKRQTASSFRNDSSFRRPRGRGYRRGAYTHSKMQDSEKQTMGNRDFSHGCRDPDMDQLKQIRKYENDPMLRDGATNEVRHQGYRRGSYNHSNRQDSGKQTLGNRDFSQGRSNPDRNQLKPSGKYQFDPMWRDGATNEVRHRQIRVEKWVKSINNECLKGDSSKTEKARYQNKAWDHEEEYLVTRPTVSDSDRIPKSNWRASKKHVPENYSATYENKDFKKQSERNASGWRKPNIPGKAEFLASLSKVEDDPPEFEISEDMIVKIEGHTVKRIYSNNHEAVEGNCNKQENVTEDQCIPAYEDTQEYSDNSNYGEDAIERYNEQENSSEDEPLPVNEDNQQGSDTKSDQWERTGRWEDCKYDGDVEQQYYVANQINLVNYASFEPEVSFEENKNPENEGKYQVNKKLHLIDGNQSENLPSDESDCVIPPMSLDRTFRRSKSLSTEKIQSIDGKHCKNIASDESDGVIQPMNTDRLFKMSKSLSTDM